MLIFALSACFVLDDAVDTPVDPSDTTVTIFEVAKGSTAGGLGPQLEAAGFIDDANMWTWYIKSRKAGGCLKAGRFELSRSMAMPELMETMCGVPVVDSEPLTIVPGWRIREIDAALADAGLADAGAYTAAANDPSRFELPFELTLENLEGFLWPETYQIERDRFTVDGFIQRQLDTFESEFLEEAGGRVDERGLYEVVIMASMLEREEPTDSQRPLVAGILWKRIDNQWNLGVDATSRYTLEVWNDRQAFLKKLRDPDDVYNTRLRAGLPPTPIGNPSVTALEASLSPEDSAFWYYLHDKNGVLHPSRNAQEHEAYRKQYNVY